MKLTSQSEYGLMALLHLARCTKDEYVSVKEISRIQGLPQKFLEQIVMSLKRAGYLQSIKGQAGGYRLAKPAHEITLAEVVRFFDGALAPVESVSTYFYEPSPIEREKKISTLFKEIRDLIAEKMENTTLADVI